LLPYLSKPLRRLTTDIRRKFSPTMGFDGKHSSPVPPQSREALDVATCSWRQALPADVFASLQDRDRICPVLAGMGLLDGDRLHMRLPGGDLRLTAPRRLLKQAFELCDGEWTWNELLGKIKSSKRKEFGQFLEFLFEQGALIDAVLLTQRTGRYAEQSLTIGKDAGPYLTQRIGGRFVLSSQMASATSAAASSPAAFASRVSIVRQTPLDDLLEKRVSIRTFSKAAVTESQVHALCWSAAGIVKARHERIERTSPRRTTGSGGAMYLVSWILVLNKPVGSYEPGVYEVAYPDERRVSLMLRSRDVSLFHRAFVRPWQQTFATGALFAVAPGEVAALRYRNRALQYLYLEAGGGLQNVALAAPAMGLATSIIGGYSEETVKSLCGLDRELVLCSAIFGGHPTATQQAAQERMLPINFDWGDTSDEIYPLPFHVARARVASDVGVETSTWGTDKDPWLAYVKAHAEAVERQGMREPRNLSVCPIGELAACIHPVEVAAYSSDQYRKADFPYKAFEPKADYQWVRGTDVATGKPTHVIASFVYRWDALACLRPLQSGQYTQANSSACGAGPTRDFALLAAFLEVLERDAFMRAWLTQTPGRRIADQLLPNATLKRVLSMRAAGCRVTLQVLPSVAAHAVLVSASHLERHFTCVAGAARLELMQAVDAGLNELEIMVYSRLTDIRAQSVLPAHVLSPAEHSGLYAQRKYFQRADALLLPTRSVNRLPSQGAARDLQGLLDVLICKGLKPAWVDITPEKNCIDQGRTPLVVVKAVVPSLIPISFGYGREPRGMLPAVDSKSFFPHPFP
jgi:ribosomal protein S12 methylthiotransferase accessory factor